MIKILLLSLFSGWLKSWLVESLSSIVHYPGRAGPLVISGFHTDYLFTVCAIDLVIRSMVAYFQVRDGPASKWPPVLNEWEQLSENHSKVGQSLQAKTFCIPLWKCHRSSPSSYKSWGKTNVEISILFILFLSCSFSSDISQQLQWVRERFAHQMKALWL